MHPLLPVMIGGASGAALRYLVGGAVSARLGAAFPYGTLIINVVGGLLMGVLAGFIARGHAGETTRLLLGVGVLGGFTTFSTFSLDCWRLIESDNLGLAFGYMALSVFGALAALVFGLWCVRIVT